MMGAQIAGFVTRDEAGLRPPRSVSYNVDPDRGGVAVHYGGNGGPPADHGNCIKRWRAWQNFHMDSRGWVDIAYNFGYCNHGYVFAGRGYGVRSAAQGTNDGNQRYLAAVWIGGGNAAPSQAALDALEWIISQVRKHGGGDDVRPHRSFHSTSCPGNYLAKFAVSLSGKTIGSTTSKPKPKSKTTAKAPVFPLPRGWYFGPKSGPRESVSGYYSHRSNLKRWQQQMRNRGWRIGVDGLYGPETADIVKAFQKEKRLGVDGLIGPKTWAAAWTAPIS
jgi:hypothetical protein